MEQELLAAMDHAAGIGRCLYQEVQAQTGGKTLPTLDAAKEQAKSYLRQVQNDLQQNERRLARLTAWVTVYVLVHQAAVHAAPVIGSSRSTGGLAPLPYRQAQLWEPGSFRKAEYDHAVRHFDPETVMQDIDTPSYLQKCLWWMQMELAACLVQKEAVACSED